MCAKPLDIYSALLPIFSSPVLWLIPFTYRKTKLDTTNIKLAVCSISCRNYEKQKYITGTDKFL